AAAGAASARGAIAYPRRLWHGLRAGARRLARRLVLEPGCVGARPQGAPPRLRAKPDRTGRPLAPATAGPRAADPRAGRGESRGMGKPGLHRAVRALVRRNGGDRRRGTFALTAARHRVPGRLPAARA